jgi:hypothetical protein
MKEDVAKKLLGFGVNGPFVFFWGWEGEGHTTNKNVWASFS